MAGEDEKHLRFLRQQACCACGLSPAGTAHHRTGAGMGLRAHDHEAMPLCAVCHDDFHRLSGRFKGWSASRRAGWQNEQVELYRPKVDLDYF